MEKENALMVCFKDIKDPRKKTHSTRHQLIDILVLTILAVICGADSWVAVEKFGHAKRIFLENFLDLSNGIPSHDTIGELFSRLDPKQLQECFLGWVNQLFKISHGEIIAVDGKTLRHSYDTASDRPAIHMVNAWACKNRLVLGQVKTENKSNEITAIPQLLKVLDLQGCTVTIDAMGCQKKIAAQIINQGGEYVFNLKGNHTQLHSDVDLYLTSVADGSLTDKNCDYVEVVDGDHGRVETRRYWVTNTIDWLEQKSDWKGLKSIGLVEYISINKTTGEEITRERRFFISAMSANVEKFSQAVRLHWGIENGLHWCLDVAFNEDACRVRKDHGPENFAVLRQIAMNLLKKESTAKVGIKNKRLMAGWDDSYLAKILMENYSG